jgi:hypothetical protein
MKHHRAMAMHLFEENGTMADGLLEALAIELNVLRLIPHMVPQIHAVPGGPGYAAAPIGHQSLNMRWRRPVGSQPMGG